MKKGLKYVHIGDEAWTCGKIIDNYQNTKKRHMVIYAPNRKEYHVFDKDIDFICTDIDDYGDICYGNVNLHGNRAIQSQLKIYILTTILDNRENWCFDLNKIPKNNKIKIIYDNGTIMNVEFNGIFEPVIINRKYIKNGVRIPYSTKKITPYGYKLIK